MAVNNLKEIINIELNLADGIAKLNGMEVALKNVRSAVNQFAKAQKDANNAVTQGIDKTGLAGAAVVELGRTISDANYGFTAMANNISQLFTLMTTLAATTGGLSNGLKAMGAALRGPLGIIVLFQILVAGLEKLSMNSKKGAKEVKSLIDAMSGVKASVIEMNALADVMDDNTASAKEQTYALKQLKKLGFDPLNESILDFRKRYTELITLEALKDVLKERVKDIVVQRLEFEEQLKQWKENVARESEDATFWEKFAKFFNIPLQEASQAFDALRTKLAPAAFNEYERLITEEGDKLAKAVKDINKILGEAFNDDDSSKKLADWADYQLKLAQQRINAAFDSIETERKLVFERKRISFLEKDDMEGFLNYAIYYYKYLSESEAFSEEERLKFRADYIKYKKQLDELETKNDEDAKKERDRIRKEELENLKSGLDAFSELITATGDILNAEYERQLTLEQNKTNEINNQLKARLRNESLSMEQRKNIQNEIAKNDEKLRIKQQEIERKKFNANKAIQMSNAIVNTASAATGVLKDTDGGSIARIAGMIAVIGAGLAQVAIIARQKFQTTASSLTGGVTNVSNGTSSNPAPDFNIVGQSGTNQLAQVVSGQLNKPFKAYVVSKEISTAQEMDRNVIGSASLG
jgi:hypothetical protein